MEKDRSRNHKSCRRDRKSIKIITADDMGLGVVTCKPKCPAGNKNKSCQPAEPSKGLKSPQIYQNPRCHAKGYGITEGVVFQAEPALSMRDPGDLAVEGIKHCRHHDRNRSFQEVALNGGHDCIEAAKKVGSGKKVRQDIDPALELSPI